MHRSVMVLVLITSGCGRLGFDPLGGSDSGGMTGDGVVGTPAKSCLGLPATCGRQRDRSCCENMIVDGGAFYRGYDVAGDGMYMPLTNPATVSSFRLDTYEVTVGRFRKFVEADQGTQVNPPTAGAGAHGNIANSGWDTSWNTNLRADRTALIAAIQCDATYETWTNAPALNESRPINCITWYEAMAFCAWDGGFLPTEAEWHYAASGGSEQRAYPWSSPPGDLTSGCMYATYGGSNWPTTGCQPSGTDNVAVRSPQGDGRWGHADLGGDVWEWGLDWFASYPNPCIDCANLSSGPGRLILGGSYQSALPDLRVARRIGTSPSIRDSRFGVRCARSAP